MLKTQIIALLGVCTFIAILFTYSSCSSSDVDEEVYLNHADDVAYVGMKTCAACHPDKHSTFIHTGMGLSFDSASRGKSSALFGPQHIVYDSILDLYYKPYWKSDKLYIKEYRISGQDTSHQLDVKIDYVVGSGQHTNSHIYAKQGYLYQAPITFYVQKQKWDLAPGFENGENSRFSRILNSECIGCHNSMPKLASKSNFKFKEIGDGIDCERCHGPGELHVNLRTRGEGVDVTNEIDRTIVNPSKLTWERQIDLCQRCHLQGLNVLKEGKSFEDFIPGMKLSEVFEIYLPEYEGENSSFHMANHSQRLQMSQCFIKGNEQGLDFTCITCHNPHVSVKVTGVEVYNSACQKCHQKKKCTEFSSVLHENKDNCVSCHMPNNGVDDIPHVSVHDHFIRVPKPKEDILKMKKLLGLYAVNNPKPELKYRIKAYLEYWEKFDKNPFYMEKAAELLRGTEYNSLWLKYYYLNEKYKEATEVSLDENTLTSWELFMIGESFAKRGQMSQSTYYLEKSFELNSTDIIVGKQLLKYYLQTNNLEKGEQLSIILIADFPMDGEIVNSMAKLYILQNRLSMARKYLALSLKLEPDNFNVWTTHLNYYAKKRDKYLFQYWVDKINTKKPNYLNPKQIKDILDSM